MCLTLCDPMDRSTPGLFMLMCECLSWPWQLLEPRTHFSALLGTSSWCLRTFHTQQICFRSRSHPVVFPPSAPQANSNREVCAGGWDVCGASLTHSAHMSRALRTCQLPFQKPRSLPDSGQRCAACLVAQARSTLRDPMDCGPPGTSVHGYPPGKNTGVS